MGRLAPSLIYLENLMPHGGKYTKRLSVQVTPDMHQKFAALCAENGIAIQVAVRNMISVVLREEESISYPKNGKQ